MKKKVQNIFAEIITNFIEDNRMINNKKKPYQGENIPKTFYHESLTKNFLKV